MVRFVSPVLMRTGTRPLWALLLLVLIGVATHSATAQETFAPPTATERLRAVARKTTAPPRIDGRLDDAEWAQAPRLGDFRQIEPDQRAPATLPTHVRVLFDDEMLYIGADLRDSAGADGVRVQDMRRDFDYAENDLFGVTIDPFGDGRVAIAFQVNPSGALRDLLVFDNLRYDRDWDAVWRARTMVSDSGWTVELAIPWTSLRYGSGPATSWGFNVYRRARRINELSAWSPWPRAFQPYYMIYAGALDSLTPPPPTTNLRVNPYLVAASSREERAVSSSTAPSTTQSAKVGGDLKWAVNANTVLDATVNTDFAQADVDRQVVNLTRFSVFFPERRQFFLENAALFRPGRLEEIEPFFSRAIGIDADGLPIPINAGARLVQRSARYSSGALLMHQGGRDDAPGSAFGVGRLIRNIGTQHYVGGMLVHRADAASGGNAAQQNTVGSLDGSYYFTPETYIRSMVAGSTTSGGSGTSSQQGLASYFDLSREANWGYVYWVQQYVGSDFRADAGFVNRPDMISANPGFRRDWRPRWRPAPIRRFLLDGATTVLHTASSRTFQEANTWFAATGEWNSAATLAVRVEQQQQRLFAPFTPLRGIAFDEGFHRFLRVRAAVASDQSRRVSGTAAYEQGAFYAGRLSTISGKVRVAPSSRLAWAMTAEHNRASSLPALSGERTVVLVGSELRLAATPRLQLSGFGQYNTNSQRVVGNARLSWEVQPLSFLYLVFNTRGGIDPNTGRPLLSERGGRELLLKWSWLGQL
jgi:hypothetical protein